MNTSNTQIEHQQSAAIESASALLELQDLRVMSASGRTLVSRASFSVREGEAVAIVGESGSGKSLTARSIIGLLPSGLEATGSIRFRGEELLSASTSRRRSLRGAEICMILQDPFTMLHPMHRCGDIITENLRDENGHRLSKRARASEAASRLAEVGIHDDRVAQQFPFEISGGMRQRVAIAAALAQNPRMLIADEPSTALDATTQHEVLELLLELQRSRGMALILITHDLRVAFSICQQVNVLYAGEVIESGASAALSDEPLHPYSLGLLLAEPPVDRRVKNFISIPGSVPRADDVAGECAFAARCQWRAPECVTAKPELLRVRDGRASACRRIEDISPAMQETRHTFAEVAAPVSVEPTGASVMSTRNLQVTFGGHGRRPAVHALRGVSIDVQAGESVGIVGESGSGKTTLSRAVVGLVRPTDGTIHVDGIDATSYDNASVSDRQQLRRSVQIVFQDPYSSLNPSHSVASALSEALSMRLDRRPRAADVEALLERVGLPTSYGSRMPVALSGGERQRVAIARAIAVQPKLLICDEPVSALDVSVQAQVLTLLRDIREELGLAYLFITHDLAVVRQVADRIYVMNQGAVVEEGSTDQVLDHPSDAYTRLLVDSVPSDHGGARVNPTPPVR
jgi:peptide/nickel transport system ATP-binding protein